MGKEHVVFHALIACKLMKLRDLPGGCWPLIAVTHYLGEELLQTRYTSLPSMKWTSIRIAASAFKALAIQRDWLEGETISWLHREVLREDIAAYPIDKFKHQHWFLCKMRDRTWFPCDTREEKLKVENFVAMIEDKGPRQVVGEDSRA